MTDQILADEASIQQHLANLLVKVNSTIHNQTTRLALSFYNLVQDLLKASAAQLPMESQQGYASMEDAASFYLKRMEADLPELKSSRSEMLDSLSSLEHIINSMCILDLKRRGKENVETVKTESHGAVKDFLDLSNELTGGQVDVEQLTCNARLKNALRQPFAVRAQLKLKYSYVVKVEQAAESARTFSALMIPGIPSCSERNKLTNDSRYHCEDRLKEALNSLLQSCAEYLKLG